MSRLRLITLFILFNFSQALWAEEIALVMADNSTPYKEFASTLEQSLRGSKWRIRYTDKVLRPLDREPVDLVITAGSDSFRATLNKLGKAPLLATLLPASAYYNILGQKPPSPTVSAIYLDQPAKRQAQLIRLLLPSSQRIGILAGEQSIAQANAFRSVFSAQRLNIVTESADNDEQVLPRLESFLPHIDALLALPDPLIYSRNSVKPLLIPAYRFRRPVIAFSAALVKAGALAALYSTPSQIGRQTGEMIIARGTRLAPPAGPSEFSLSINHSVASTFGLRLPDEAELFQQLLTGGKE